MSQCNERPFGKTPWKDILERPLEKTPWKNPLERPKKRNLLTERQSFHHIFESTNCVCFPINETQIVTLLFEFFDVTVFFIFKTASQSIITKSSH